MRPTFRSLAFGLATLLGAGAMAQNMVTITGTVQPCNGISYPVQIQTNTVPPIDTVVYSGPNCDYSFTFYPVQTQGTVTVTTTCDGGITFTSGTGSFTPLLGVVVIDLACGGGTLDCTGILNGPNMPGTACTTFLGEAGVWSANCVCEVTGNTVDCLGVIGGSALPGTPCDDGNAQTLNDTWTPFCSCLGSPAGECWAGYMVEPLMVSGVPVPWQVVFHVWSTGVEPFTVTWYVEGDVIVGGADLTYTVSGPGAITW
ncbi:MAG TPA: hypothetical protein VKG92_01300, partial [Flavobacteriales bacterium]|nr:hypothetical protein [Flavobacteriales bacterium]